MNLPNVPISDIKVHHKDLVVSTQGRAIWILDNLTLHQLTSNAKPSGLTLFKPRDVPDRVGPTVLGPVVDYYLPAAHTLQVVIEILDTKGTAQFL